MRHVLGFQSKASALGATALIALLIALFVLPSVSLAAGPREINASVQDIHQKFISQHPGAMELFEKANGVLTFPRLLKAGFGIGAEYGEGNLRVGRYTVDYYNFVAGSFGFQIGGQARTVMMFFMDQGALDKFRKSSNWQIGVDASVAIVTLGVGERVDTTKLNQPIVAFIFDQKGAMFNLTLEGGKITKLDK